MPISFVGEISVKKNKGIEISAYLVSASKTNGSEKKLKATLRVDNSQLDLAPTDGLAHLTPLPENLNGQKVYRAGLSGGGMPICFHMPNPPLTQDAKSFNFVGDVVDAIINTNAKIAALQIVDGAPYGLNEVTLKTMEEWGCRPAKFNGSPVPTLVTFQVHLQAN